jgi:hypothetical protein
MAVLLIIAYIVINIKANIEASTTEKKQLMERSKTYLIPEPFASTISHKKAKGLQIAFANIDKNGTGSVDAQELLIALREFDASDDNEVEDASAADLESIETVKEMFAEVDVNGDGEIDFNEFVTIM